MRESSLNICQSLDLHFYRTLTAQLAASGIPCSKLIALYAIGGDGIAIHGMDFVHDDHPYAINLREQLDHALATASGQRESLALLVDLQATSCSVMTLESALAKVQKQN